MPRRHGTMLCALCSYFKIGHDSAMLAIIPSASNQLNKVNNNRHYLQASWHFYLILTRAKCHLYEDMQPMFDNIVQYLEKLSSHNVGMLVHKTFTDGQADSEHSLHREDTKVLFSAYCTTLSNIAYVSVSQSRDVARRRNSNLQINIFPWSCCDEGSGGSCRI